MLLRGSSEDEPSPSKSAWRNARLIAAGPCQTNSGTNFAALRCPDQLAEHARPKRGEVLDVELVQHAAGGDRALADVPRAADRQVVGGEDADEELPVDVVEAGPLLATPSPR